MIKNIIIFIALSSAAFALGPLKFGVQLGLSTPDDQFANVYNQDNVRYLVNPNMNNEEEIQGDLISDGVENGYHLGINLRINLSEDFSLLAGFMYNSLNESRMTLRNPQTGDSVATFLSSQRIVPISGGIMYHFLELGILEFYLRGDAQINYIAFETKFEYQVSDLQVAIPIASTDSYARIGYAFGGGVDFDLELIRVNLDFRFNTANLLGRTQDEAMKSYYTFGAGIFF